MVRPDVFMSDDADQFYISLSVMYMSLVIQESSYVQFMFLCASITHGEKVLINILVMPKTK